MPDRFESRRRLPVGFGNFPGKILFSSPCQLSNIRKRIKSCLFRLIFTPLQIPRYVNLVYFPVMPISISPTTRILSSPLRKKLDTIHFKSYLFDKLLSRGFLERAERIDVPSWRCKTVWRFLTLYKQQSAVTPYEHSDAFMITHFGHIYCKRFTSSSGVLRASRNNTRRHNSSSSALKA